MPGKLSRKIKFLILTIKIPLRAIYKAVAAMLDFFIYKFSVMSTKQFSDLKFLKIIGSNDIGSNKNIKGRLTAGSCRDSIYEIIQAGFDKLNFIECGDLGFIKENLGLSETGEIISAADMACRHEFDLLGSGKVKVDYNLKAVGLEGYVYDNNPGDNYKNAAIKNLDKLIGEIFNLNEDKPVSYVPIDWHADFKSGYRWDSSAWHKKIKYGQLPGVDIKVPWELSRACHFAALGQAYSLTSDEKYTKEFICQVTDWIVSNPAGFGVNWACTMDVAIRSCNWVLGFSFFKDSPLINKEFLALFSKSLYLHGKHIERNLEKGMFRVKNNHYVSDIAGLLYLGLFFNFTGFGQKWLQAAVMELKHEISSQVYEDGTDFEASSFYHRLALELFFYPMFFSIKCSPDFTGSNYIETGEKLFGTGYVGRIKKMSDVLVNLIHLNGQIPQIGDNDSGKLHVFSNNEIVNLKYLLSILETFYCGLLPDNSAIMELDLSQPAIWLFGRNCMEARKKLSKGSIKSLKSVSFNDSGWYLIKNIAKNNGVFSILAITCGPNGQKDKGGHSHNDKLSFSLSINGINIFADPGTYIYTPMAGMRNDFRSTCFHNTVCIDNQEQNRFIAGNIFIVSDDSKAKVNCFFENSLYYFFSGEHYGYSRLNNPVIHERQFVLIKEDGTLIIKDIFKGGTGNHLYDFVFNLDPGIKFEAGPEGSKISFALPDNIGFNLYKVSNLKLRFSAEQSFYSGAYGLKESAVKLKYSTASENIFDTYFVFSPGNGKYETGELESIFNELKR